MNKSNFAVFGFATSKNVFERLILGKNNSISAHCWLFEFQGMSQQGVLKNLIAIIVAFLYLDYASFIRNACLFDHYWPAKISLSMCFTGVDHIADSYRSARNFIFITLFGPAQLDFDQGLWKSKLKMGGNVRNSVSVNILKASKNQFWKSPHLGVASMDVALERTALSNSLLC